MAVARATSIRGSPRMLYELSLLFMTALPVVQVSTSADTPPFDRKIDVVYGRKHGMALTMDVFTPTANANGAAIVWIVSGGWFSAHGAINPRMIDEFLKRGYTVFAVVHGSQPRFTIPEITEDLNRAVRFIRHNAKEYH